MRILVVHNAYQRAGGEDAVVAAEVALLRSAGHVVHLEVVTNHEIEGVVAKADAFLRAPYAPSRFVWTRDLLRQSQAEVVHVHNFFPLLTPAIHEAAASAGVAVVQTLHNFRITCANALLLRDNHVCEKCVGGPKIWGVVHRCYRGSLPGSLAVVRMQWRAARHKTWHRFVHRFIALTEFGRQKFVAAGLPAERLVVKPNFVNAAGSVEHTDRRGALFVGRLSPEKGAEVLLKAWQQLPDVPLTVAGDGPGLAQFRAAAGPNVRFLGRVSNDEVLRQLDASQLLIIPSTCYEGFPLASVEAFSRGVPVVASRLGSLREIIVDSISGVHFSPGDSGDLAAKVAGLMAEPQRLTELGRGARRQYETTYTPAQNLAALEDIYAAAISEAASQRA